MAVEHANGATDDTALANENLCICHEYVRNANKYFATQDVSFKALLQMAPAAAATDTNRAVKVRDETSRSGAQKVCNTEPLLST